MKYIAVSKKVCTAADFIFLKIMLIFFGAITSNSIFGEPEFSSLISREFLVEKVLALALYFFRDTEG